MMDEDFQQIVKEYKDIAIEISRRNPLLQDLKGKVMFAKRPSILPTVKTVAARYKVPSLLLDAMIAYESSYDPFASKYEADYIWLSDPGIHCKANKTSLAFETEMQKTSLGLCQVMGGTARWLGHRSDIVRMFDIPTNLSIACTYIKKLEKKYGSDMDSVIAAYNRGSVSRVGNKFINQTYVDQVRKHMDLLKGDH